MIKIPWRELEKGIETARSAEPELDEVLVWEIASSSLGQYQARELDREFGIESEDWDVIYSFFAPYSDELTKRVPPPRGWDWAISHFEPDGTFGVLLVRRKI